MEQINTTRKLIFLYDELKTAIKELEEFKRTKERYSNRMLDFREKLVVEESKLIKKGNRIIREIAAIEGIEDVKNTYVNINDIIDIRMVYAEDDEEEMTLHLTSGDATIFDGKLSVNTPLGEAIYGCKVGENIVYKVNNNVVNVRVLKKVPAKISN